MKALVTILQCRRVVLPYVFMRYALPRMREVFPGDIEVLLIQHRAKNQGFARLRSQHLGKDREVLVDRWTADGRYSGAEIRKHDIWHAPYPSIPSYHIAVQAALDRQVDFHLYLEDDALVLDPECGRWDELLGPAEVGVYRPRTHVINSSWFVTRPSFDQRILPGLARYWWWRRSSRIEWWFKRKLRGELAILDESYAVKNHHNEYPFTGMRFVVDRLTELCPDDLDLLEIDFGDEAREVIDARRAAPSDSSSPGGAAVRSAER
jgi:hypothetical protein